MHRHIRQVRPLYPKGPIGLRDIKVVLFVVVGLIFTANAYLTAAGKLDLTKMKYNPFESVSSVQAPQSQPNAPVVVVPQ